MGAAPQQRLQIPPRRSSSNALTVILLSLAVIIVLCGLVVWAGLRFVTHNVQVHVAHDGGGQNEVSIKTPIGGIEVNKSAEATEGMLGLPIYPGARRVKDSDSASINIGLPNDESVRIVVAKFQTNDPIAKVKDFYSDRLSGQVTKFTETDRDGKTVFEIKHGELEKVVALKNDGDLTRIEIVHVGHGRSESN